MAKVLTRISFDEFTQNVARYFELVLREQESVVVENGGGAEVLLQPAKPQRGRRIPRRKRTAADHEAFLAALGGWKDLVDTDKLIANVYESRRIPSRPPVEL